MNIKKKIKKNNKVLKEYKKSGKIEKYEKYEKTRILWLKKDGNNYEKIGKIKVANDFKSRLVGLMFKKNIDYPLLFEIPYKFNNIYRSSIHSCFMRFELKIVFIDENNTVFEIADLKPWKLHIPKRHARFIIEFDKKEFDKYGIKLGSEIEIK